MDDSTGSVAPEAGQTSSNTPLTTARPTILQILFVGLVMGLFTTVWLIIYSTLNSAIWDNSFVTSNKWMIPALVMFFSLLVGLVEKYLRAPNMIKGGFEGSLKAGAKVDYSNFFGTLLSSFFSLFSGASVGPEAALGFLAVDVTAWLGNRLKIARQFMPEFLLAGLASTYNGVVGSPLFGTMFATESSGAVSNLLLVGWTLVGGTVGYLVLTLLHIPPFAGYFNVGSIDELSAVYIVYAIILGLVGSVLALWTGIALRIANRFMSVFKDRIILRVLVAGAIIAVIGYFIPDLLFSGEAAVHKIIANAASYGIPMLLLLALLKPLLLGISLKGGYLGGAVFPSLYTATMVGLAINIAFPSIPLILILATIQAGMITLVLRAPLTAILLVAAVTVANPNLLELITVATATAMIAGAAMQKLRAQPTPEVDE